ncbi:AraC-type DNA-binding protein [Desulfomicrobium norvegicum]|uniref:AraC-type DNA-binding protein n=1 Tax=Desulfomicrobium norvegicum (strain DSM 1741 / NCIMB 8310) TaxID=52561 RepID=A0A8G2C2V9_DESNO|nr:AraC family transcriptional regulator [Desulfomicrobium norvegicum]SFL72095.1 AraC-type DNA-binding protein [Desulfomicrobium norvegicum]
MSCPSISFLHVQPGLEMSQVARSSHVFPRHFHDDLYAIGLMHQGASYCLGPSHSEATLRQGQACLINPGQVHSGVPISDDTISYTMFYLRADLVRSMAEDMSRRPEAAPEFTTLICDCPDLVMSLYRLAQNLTASHGLARESALVRTLGDILGAHCGVKSESPALPMLVRHAKEMLRSNLDHKLTLRDMAAVLGVSQYHLLRTFKRQTGIPPHVFRTQQRVERAKSLIRQGMVLSEVAQVTGFADQSHFSNTFKLYTAATPGQYALLP